MHVTEYVKKRFVIEATVIKQKMAQKLKDDMRAAMKAAAREGDTSGKGIAEGTNGLLGEDLGVRPLSDNFPITE